MKNIAMLTLWTTVLIVVMSLLSACKYTEMSTSPLSSPLQSNSTISSPSARSILPTMPAVEETPVPGSIVEPDIDLEALVLRPGDMQPFFDHVTYAITQPYESESMWGLLVTYPTEILQHTTAFAEGFSTQVEMYKEYSQAVDMYYLKMKALEGERINLDDIADKGVAFVLSPTLSELNKHEYTIIMRKGNVLITIEIRRAHPITEKDIKSISGQTIDKIPY
jgi:hypothetical protein